MGTLIDKRWPAIASKIRDDWGTIVDEDNLFTELAESFESIVNGEDGYDHTATAGIRNDLPEARREALLRQIDSNLRAMRVVEKSADEMLTDIGILLVASRLTPEEKPVLARA